MKTKTERLKDAAGKTLPAAAILILLLLTAVGNVRTQKINTSTQSYLLTAQLSDNTFARVSGNNITFYIKPGAAGTGGPIVKNDENREREVNVVLEGELAQKNMITTPFPSFTLGPNQSRFVTLTVNMPGNATGIYSGKLTIKLK